MKIIRTLFFILCFIQQNCNAQIVTFNATLESPCAALKLPKPKLPSFEIYPNPSQGSLFINLKNRSETGLIKIYDVKGSLVYKKLNLLKEESLNLHKLKNGFYFLVYDNKKEKITKKLIIQK